MARPTDAAYGDDRGAVAEDTTAGADNRGL